MDPRESRALEVQSAIRAVLLEDWDPIDVQHVPEAQGEYDGYVGSVYRLLARGASAEEIAEHLARVERESIGLSTTATALIAVARKLKQLDIRLSSA